jgi:hypothetical protein
MGKVRMMSRKTGKTEALFGETLYAAGKRSHRRRVIIKAEVVRCPGRDPRNNDLFVVTNIPYKPETVYKIYRGRGDAGNRIEVRDASSTRYVSIGCSRGLLVFV